MPDNYPFFIFQSTQTMPHPFLTDGCIFVRPPTLGDVAAFCVAANESAAEVGRWLPWCHADYREAEAQTYIAGCIDAWARLARFPFLILDCAGGQLLGGIGVNNIDMTNRRGSLGYWVRTSQTGRGVALAAARLVSKFAFAEAGLARVEIAVIAENVASRRVAEKLGAKPEGIARDRIVMHGKAYDAVLYSLIPADTAGAAPSVGEASVLRIPAG
jgi:RimJ/RimL family protein N-acetyltransferase